MGNSMKWLAAGVLCASAIGAQAQVTQTRVWAAACASCHGTDNTATLTRRGLDCTQSGRKGAMLLPKVMASKSAKSL